MPQLKFLENGPLLLGNKAYCRCGQSEHKPFCDGTHKSAQFSFVAPEVILSLDDALNLASTAQAAQE